MQKSVYIYMCIYLSLYIYVFMSIHVCVNKYIYIYIYISRSLLEAPFGWGASHDQLRSQPLPAGDLGRQIRSGPALKQPRPAAEKGLKPLYNLVFGGQEP